MKSTAEGARRSRWGRWALGGVGLLALAGAVGLSSGTETRLQLCPDTLEVRAVSEVKLAGLTVRHAVEARGGGLQAWLRARGLVEPSAPGARWVTGSARLIGGGCAIGPARHVATPLATQDWGAWSQEHPQLAAWLWPQVVTLSRAERYDQAGTLLWEAWQGTEGGEPAADLLARLESLRGS